MPLYQFYCETCDEFEDRVCPWESKRMQAHRCGEILIPLLSPVTLIGPTPTKPDLRGGKRFETASALSRWERDNPGLVTVSKKDRVIKDKINDGRQLQDLKAKELGFRDEKERQREVKKEGGLPP